MKLVIGLGNPGQEYSNTRHNIGFRLVDYFLDSHNLDVKWSKKNEGLYYITNIEGEKILFLKPQTYMNLSGDCVRKYMDYYQVEVDDILIISDDLDLNVGNYKLKISGSFGGHNGLRDIENKIHSSNYKRLKIGISNNKDMDTKDYVLGSFSKEENTVLNHEFEELVNVLNDYFKISFSDLMCKYNRKNK